jgi:hypothetical protein
MGQVNQPADIISRIADMQRQIDELRRSVGLSSATISRGGLTIKNGAFFEMISDTDTQTVYIGPSIDAGHQTFQVRRTDGTLVLDTQKDQVSGNDYWALWGRDNQMLVSDDVQSGHGLARPYLSIPMYQLFTTNVALGSVVAYNTVDATAITTEKALWEGRIPLGSHPRITVDGVWGQASGSNNTTFKLKVAGGVVGSWTENGTLEVARKGPYDITSVIGNESITVQVTAVSSGSGAVGCQVFGCYLRQS